MLKFVNVNVPLRIYITCYIELYIQFNFYNKIKKYQETFLPRPALSRDPSWSLNAGWYFPSLVAKFGFGEVFERLPSEV